MEWIKYKGNVMIYHTALGFSYMISQVKLAGILQIK